MIAGSPCPLFSLVQHMVTLEELMFHFLSNKGQYTVWCMFLDPHFVLLLTINAYGAHDMITNTFTIFVTTLSSPLPNLPNYYTNTKLPKPSKWSNPNLLNPNHNHKILTI